MSLFGQYFSANFFVATVAKDLYILKKPKKKAQMYDGDTN